MGSNRFELCCIPAYAFDLALGDIVATGAGTDRQYVVGRVEVSSGRFAFRAWVEPLTKGRPLLAAARLRDELVSELEGLGALVEMVSPNLLAIDARDGEQAQVVAGYLAERERAGHLMYETGRQS